MSALKVLYFSGCEWDDRWRRKQRLAYELAQQPEVASLLYVNPPVKTSILDWARGSFEPSHLGTDRGAHWDALWGRARKTDGRVWVTTGTEKCLPLTKSKAVRRLGALQSLNRMHYVHSIRRTLRRLPGNRLILWLCHPLQVFALDAFAERDLACYDWTDDWVEFEILPVADAQDLVEWNDRILSEVDIVFAVSEELYRRASAVNANTLRAPNATDMSMLGGCKDARSLLPSDVAALPKPVIGYIGQIGDKIDYELVQTLAEARPRHSFAFVGNVWSNHPEQIELLSQLPNVHFLGQRAYDELPGYLAGFSVCIMPHLCNALTRSMDPIKLYDYLASGKPIVSTPVAGSDRFPDVVYVGGTPAEFLLRLDEALRENGRLEIRRRAYARENTWSRRAGQIWDAIRAQLCL